MSNETVITGQSDMATLRDYVERSTHWQEGGADRHCALMALAAIEDRLAGATVALVAAISHIDKVCDGGRQEVTYETAQRSGFRRKDGRWRNYTLRDAKLDAKNAGENARRAWDILDPVLKL